MVNIVTETPSAIINESFAISLENWDSPQFLAYSQIHMDKLWRTVALEPGAETLPLPYAEKSLNVDAIVMQDPLTQRPMSGDQLLNCRVFNDALLVMHKGQVVHESYRNGMIESDRHVIHSTTKSHCAMLIAIAIENGLMNVEAAMSNYIPELEVIEAWQGVKLSHVLDMVAGLSYDENYEDPNSVFWDYAKAVGYYPSKDASKVIGAKAWLLKNLVERSDVPGDKFLYNSTLTNVLGVALENVYQKGLAELFEEMLYSKVGAEAEAYFNTDHLGFPITEGQLNLTLRDFTRTASLMINDGKNLQGEQIIPQSFIEQVVTPDAAAQLAFSRSKVAQLSPSGQYKQQFWVLEPEAKRFAMLGIHGQFAYYDLNNELMITGFSSHPTQDDATLFMALLELWKKITLSLTE
jgi:CubicO group peptidase (beta-lactamase class C family)